MTAAPKRGYLRSLNVEERPEIYLSWRQSIIQQGPPGKHFVTLGKLLNEFAWYHMFTDGDNIGHPVSYLVFAIELLLHIREVI